MKLKATVVAAFVAALSVLPLGATASACDPDGGYPCDPQPYDLKQLICKFDPRC